MLLYSTSYSVCKGSEESAGQFWDADLIERKRSRITVPNSIFVKVPTVQKCSPAWNDFVLSDGTEMMPSMEQKCSTNQRNKNNLKASHLTRTTDAHLTFGEYHNVFLTEKEYKQLNVDFSENGLAVEPVLIRKKFLKWQDAHPEFPRIVFHGLRHSSATYQLIISGGDVKAVQGTTGHATADMLVNTYAHIQQSSRVELGKKFEEGFYAKQENPSQQAVPAEGEPTISMSALLELLKNAGPEVKAQLRLALLT